MLAPTGSAPPNLPLPIIFCVKRLIPFSPVATNWTGELNESQYAKPKGMGGRQTCLYRGEQQGDCECAQCRRRNSESSPASHHAEARRQKQNGTCCDNPSIAWRHRPSHNVPQHQSGGSAM